MIPEGGDFMAWKTPEYYKTVMQHSCNYSIRQQIGCMTTFWDRGFLKNSIWDEYAMYELLCKQCPHYSHNVSIYFGNGNTDDHFEERSAVWCRCIIRNREEFAQAISHFPKHIKAVFFDSVDAETLTGLEQFTDLECALIGNGSKLIHFWDFTKTPKLKVLEYVSNKRLTDLSEIAQAKELEYFGIETLTSRVNLMYVDSFAPFKQLSHLKELSLNGVMCSDNRIDDLIDIPNMEKLWISPHTFSVEDFAEFEARKFKIYEEYGIFKNGTFIRALGKRGRYFRSESEKEKFSKKYNEMMLNFADRNES